MKKVLFIFLILILANCNSQKKYSDFDYSYSRSGGKMATYENLLIKGENVYYSFESKDKNVKKEFKITKEDLQKIEDVLTKNNFRRIEEDIRKVYDNVATVINVKNGPNSGHKSDASFIKLKDNKRWNEVKEVFKQFIPAQTDSENSGK